MAANRKMTKFLLVLIFLILASSCTFAKEEETKDLEGAEANGKLEIIKQIKKINEDGSYTIGYEADDGSFKIESRDVLGNIKGTYGYIDENGEIKRVSYSSTNGSLPSSSIQTNKESISDEKLPPSSSPTSTPSSVVQRIPKILKNSTASASGKYSSSTTRRPIIVYPNLSTPATVSSTRATTSVNSNSNNIIQTIPRRRLVGTGSTTTTTEKSQIQTHTHPQNQIYSTVAPARILIQSRPILRSDGKEEVLPNRVPTEVPQIIRPDLQVQQIKSTDNPSLKKLVDKNTLLDTESSSTRPVTESISEEGEVVREVKSNLLRRQLNPDKIPFDPRQHVMNLQQAGGHDQIDVYSSSVTTGTPRPLFTTTLRPKYLGSSSTLRPTARLLAFNSQTSTSTNPPVVVTPAPVSVQIPANKNNNEVREEYVPIRHPFHRGTIFVPLAHFQQAQAQAQPQEALPTQQEPRQFLPTKEQYLREVQPSASPIPQVPILIQSRKPVASNLRPMPVQVDENGYIREVPPPQFIPMNVLQPHNYQEQLQEEIDRIKPPVSTRDFQKLLEQLILRQSRLEQISTLVRPQMFRATYHQQEPMRMRYVENSGEQQRQIFVPVPVPVQVRPQRPPPPQLYYRTTQEHQQLSDASENQEENLYYRQPHQMYQPQYQIPHKRMVRLEQGSENGEYLPVDVREMLLLRMLQLAINPALPLDENEMNNIVTRSTTTTENLQELTNNNNNNNKQTTNRGMRNVEILGEENEPKSRPKRYVAF